MNNVINNRHAIAASIAFLFLVIGHELISRPYESLLLEYDRENYEKEDANFEPELNELIKLSLPRLEEVAYKTDAKSQYLVGMRYQFGVQAFPDYDKARQWYQRSADGGDPAGMFWLSRIDHSLSKERKNELLEKSAELGYWRARRELMLKDASRNFSNTRERSDGLKINIPSWEHQDFYIIYKKAMDMYMKKVVKEQGDRIKINLFKIESDDDRLILELFKTAALGGDNKAQHWLGRFYQENDPEQSERWFFHSAYNSNRDAYESVRYIQSKKFFTKEKLQMDRKTDSLSYHNPESLREDKKYYARVSYFWKELAGDSGGFDYDLRFYERWPIERIVKECKTIKINSKESCVENYRHGVVFGETFLSELFD